jgi:microsomal dipeptidase-like Zn-dependent dipeptidase
MISPDLLRVTWQLHHAIATYKNFEFVTTSERVLRVKQEGKVGVLSFEGCEALRSEPRFLDLYY